MSDDVNAVFTKLPTAFKLIAPNALSSWPAAIQPVFIKYHFITVRRVAAALGQMTVESQGFTRVSENLDYSAERLRAVWPSRFPTTELAQQYAHQPVKLANYVYANRMGNAGANSGDGWKRRGAGLIQLTGTTNQEAYAATITLPAGMDVSTYLQTAEGAIDSACWFLVTNANFLRFADTWQITHLSRAVNGGDEGLADRIKFSVMVREALS